MSGAAPGAPAPILEVEGLKKYFPVTRGAILRSVVGHVKAVDGVSFSIAPGETLGLVGESGSGKTTIGRCILKLEENSDGAIRFDGRDIATLERPEMAAFRRNVQAIFQDPFSSLNPRMRAGDIVAEPLRVHRVTAAGRETHARVAELFDICGLPRIMTQRFPHEMSGGQRQRIGIARALALNPRFIVCDEPVSALDVSIQAQIINLLEALRDEFGLTYLFIGHDLSVVRHLCHRVAVMYLGRIVEIAETDELFDRPRHPYTQALLSAVPVPDPEIERERPHRIVPGEVPSPMNPPSGCVFHPRCDRAIESCRRDIPALREIAPGHRAACPRIEEG